MNATTDVVNQERPGRTLSGWFMLLVGLVVLGLTIWIFVAFVRAANGLHHGETPPWPLLLAAILLAAGFFVNLGGFFTLQPNEARVLILFGAYKGTVRTSGFHWANPFYAQDHNRHKVSLRARNFNSDKLKVNDRRGNPIEIAAVVVWRVADTAQASFDVDSY